MEARNDRTVKPLQPLCVSATPSRTTGYWLPATWTKNCPLLVNRRRGKRVMAVAVLLGVCILSSGCCRCYWESPAPAEGDIEISFRINDPVRYDDEEPLQDPQTVVWLEHSCGRYVRSLMVSDWTAMGGWRKQTKTAAGKEVRVSCPRWQQASDWPDGHSKTDIDAVTKATPGAGAHTVRVSCRKMRVPPGDYRYYVQTTVAPVHSILYSAAIHIGGPAAAAEGTVTYIPEMHKDAGPVLSNVKARYRP